MNNIKNLTNDQLFKEYQTSRQNLLNAIEGSKEEIKADRLFTELAKEVSVRNMDLKSYKLLEQKETDTKVKSNTIKKSIKTIVSTLLITATILSTSNSVPAFAENIKANITNSDKYIIQAEYNDSTYILERDEDDNTIYNIGDNIKLDLDSDEVHEALSGEYSAIVVNSYPEQDNLVVIKIGDNLYSFLADDGGWLIDDEMIVTMENDEVIEARPVVDLKTFYKSGSPNTIYANDLKTDEDLTNYAIEFLKDNYNDTLDVPIEFNKIYNADDNEVVYGMTTFEDDKATGIIIDSNLVYSNDSIQIERTLIHELLHYELARQGKGYEDGQEDFENEVIKQGSCSNSGNKGVLHTHLKSNILQ